MTFKSGDKVYIFDVTVSTANLKGAPSLFDENTKQVIDFLGRIGHTKNEAIDGIIAVLENYKD